VNIEIDNLKFDEQGLIPAIVQDSGSREVLMLAYVNIESLNQTLEAGETWFWSRSRSKLWHKGETTGNTQQVVKVLVDCDQDSLLMLVKPRGPACHTNNWSCFQDEISESKSTESPPEIPDLGLVLLKLYQVVHSRMQERPEGSYTTYLFTAGLDKILKKIGEEAAELIVAAKNRDVHSISSEASDLIYHLMVLLVEEGVTLDQVRDELYQRQLSHS
jgi:phosphoribosyl-ATP pyrophosphohydrolase/phosphoribosyl-AMP cyclohydrolase